MLARALAMIGSSARRPRVSASAASRRERERSMGDMGCGGLWKSLPLDGGGRFGTDVEDDAGNVANLIGDAAGYLVQQIVGQAGPVGGHGVLGLDDAQRDDVGVVALVADDADGLDRQEHGEGLPDLPIPAALHHFVLENGVGLTENLETGRGDVAGDTPAEAGAGEWLAPDD